MLHASTDSSARPNNEFQTADYCAVRTTPHDCRASFPGLARRLAVCGLVPLMAVSTAGCRSHSQHARDAVVVESLSAGDYQPPPDFSMVESTLSAGSGPALAPGVVDGEEPVPVPVIPAWPGNAGQVAIAWSDGHPVTLTPRGAARVNEMGVLELSDGAILVDEASARLLEQCTQSNELTIEVVLRSASGDQSGPARIITFSTDHHQRNFTLGQDGDQLILRLRTTETGANGIPPELRLAGVPLDEPMHLIVTYRSGELVVYVDGKEMLHSDEIRGDFSNWEPHHLVLGDEFSGERDWDGQIERFAIHSRFMNAKVASVQYESAVESIAGR